MISLTGLNHFLTPELTFIRHTKAFCHCITKHLAGFIEMTKLALDDLISLGAIDTTHMVNKVIDGVLTFLVGHYFFKQLTWLGEVIVVVFVAVVPVGNV